MLIVLIYTPSITEVVKLQKKGNKLSLVDNQDVANLMLTMQMNKREVSSRCSYWHHMDKLRLLNTLLIKFEMITCMLQEMISNITVDL